MIKKKNFEVKDPMSALTHFIGFLAVIPCAVFLIRKALGEHSIFSLVGFIIFSISLLLLYGASTIYHTLKLSDAKTKILRRIDHMMIFVLIAGTYTPICLIALEGAWRWGMLTLIWAIAIAGILMKAFWLTAPRWLSTGIYILMGWLAVIVFFPLGRATGMKGLLLLLSGGIAYTVGAVIYGTKKPNLTFKNFGFHEIFHVFVLIGSGIHIAFMFECL